ncbi:MAG: acetolactate synthase large subunit [Syntrophorhabdaceae bacterium]|nr:acetolactate synthase large subunit [Syntrophorhabdaceae bacterium]
MNGAELILKIAVSAGINLSFVNAGTTEIPLLSAFDGIDGIRPVLCLDENVGTGAADGYGRLLDRPSMVVLHHGPGLANGIANLHNGKRARSPILLIVGDHATWHKKADPPLNMDIEGLLDTCTHRYRRVSNAAEVAGEMGASISETLFGHIAALIVPHDVLKGETLYFEPFLLSHRYDPLDWGYMKYVARLLERSKRPALLLDGRAFHRNGLKEAARIKAKTGCDLVVPAFPGYMERGAGLPSVERIPYFPEGGIKLMAQYDTVILAGARDPVTFFGYDGIQSYLIPETSEKIFLCDERQDVVEALKSLAEILEAPEYSQIPDTFFEKPLSPMMPTGSLNPEKIGCILSALQPYGAIIVDEGLTTALPYYLLSRGSPPHFYTTVTGGAIGYGMPCAIGAALAYPDRVVINFQADGSAMYTIQSLWTQAKEGLNIKTLVCSNRSYNILKLELARAGITKPGRHTLSMVELKDPAIDWVKVAEGFGVPAVSVDDSEGLIYTLKRELLEPGPYLIEMVL